MLLVNSVEFKLGHLIKRLELPGSYRVSGMARSGGQPGFSLVRTVNFGAEGGVQLRRGREAQCAKGRARRPRHP